MDINKTRMLYHRLRRELLWIPHKYLDNFVFIHIPKTGGSSIEKALKLPHMHDRALTLEFWLGKEKYSKRFSFSIVRNPWDLNVSLYHFRLQSSQLINKPADFNEWIKLVYVEKNPKFYKQPYWEHKTQRWWLEDKDGNIMVDYIAKLETIDADWEYICQQIGTKTSLPHTNRSSRKH